MPREKSRPVATYIPGRPRSASNLAGHWPHVLLARSMVGTCAVGKGDGFRQTPVRKRCQAPPRVRLAGNQAGTWAVGNEGDLDKRGSGRDAKLPNGFGWPEAWPAPGPLDTRVDLDTRRSGGMHVSPLVRLARSLAGTCAIGNAEGYRQTPVRKRCKAPHAFGWPAPSFPRVRLARSLAGTWAVGNAERFRQTPVRKRCQASHGFGWPEAWPAPGPLETRTDFDKRRSEIDAGLHTGSVGQKTGRHLGRWKRGGI